MSGVTPKLCWSRHFEEAEIHLHHMDTRPAELALTASLPQHSFPPRYSRPATISAQAIYHHCSSLVPKATTQPVAPPKATSSSPSLHQSSVKRPSHSLVPRHGIVSPLRPRYHSPWIHLLHACTCMHIFL